MKTLILVLPALLLAACGDGGADPITIVDNGTEPCAHRDCVPKTCDNGGPCRENERPK